MLPMHSEWGRLITIGMWVLTGGFSVTMSEKGWSDNELGLEWLKIYDCETQAKANGHWRAVILDGHDTHVTLEVIQHAHTNKIVIACLPPHTTHVLQPLDLGLNGPLKIALREEAYTYEFETGRAIDKMLALLVISRTFNCMFTKNNIQSAFRRSGIWPLNRAAIDASATAPSQSTSTTADAPHPLPTVVKEVVHAFNNLSPIKSPDFTAQSAESSVAFPRGDSPSTRSDRASEVDACATNQSSPLPSMQRARKYAMATRGALMGSSHQHIVSSDPAGSTDPLPPLTIRPMLPIRRPNFTLLQPDPAEASLSTSELLRRMNDLRLELDLARLHLDENDRTIRVYQAQLVIGAAHSKRQQKQLAAREEKDKKKESNTVIKPDVSKGRVVSCEEAEQYEIARKEAAAHKEAEKAARQHQKQQLREERAAEKEARGAQRAAEKAERAAVKLRGKALTLARKRRREADLDIYEAELRNWQELTAGWERGMGRKPAKPTKPKVRKGSLTEAEIATSMAIITGGGGQGGIESHGQLQAAGTGKEVGPDSSDNETDRRTNGRGESDGSSRSTSPEAFEFSDDGSEWGD